MADTEASATDPTETPAAPALDDAQGEGDAPKEPEQPPRLARQFAALSRQKREFERERQAFKAEMDKGRAELARLNQAREEIMRIRDARQRERDDPWANDPHREYLDQRLSEKEKAITEKLRQVDAMRAEMAKQHHLGQVRSVLQQAPDDFELIATYDAAGDVVELMDLYAQQHGELLDHREACKFIEEELEREEYDRVQRGLKTRKLAKRIGWNPSGAPSNAENQPAEKAPEQRATPKPARGKPKLTNDAAAAVRRGAQPDDPDAIWERLKAKAIRRR